MLKSFEVRKFIALILVVAYILLIGFVVCYAVFSGEDIKIPAEFAAFSGMVGLVVGQYFGKSTYAEGSKMNKDP
jgi:hypothetical protein